MTKREEIFVSNKLDNMRSFRYKDDFSVNLNNFSILELNKILSLGNNNGMLMLSISYYIDIFFSKYTIKQKSVFFLQTDKYINKLEFDKEGKNGKITCYYKDVQIFQYIFHYIQRIFNRLQLY